MEEPLLETASRCFCEAKKLPFLAQVLSLERKCYNKSGYVYMCRFGDFNADKGL
jgi:hypothetical protein